MVKQLIRARGVHVLLCAALSVLGIGLSMASPVVAKTMPQRDSAQTTARPFAAATGAASVFGIDDGGVLSSSQTNVDLAAATGANWERISLWWRNVEATEGVYDFTSSDKTLNRLLDAGFSLIVYVDKNPTWAADTTCGPLKPGKVQAFANLYSALAARYPNVKVWAAYNEVDFDYADIDRNTGGCFGGRGSNGDLNNNGKDDYKDYAEMLAAAHKAVHAANPNAQFAMGAMSYDNFNVGTAPSDYPGGGSGGLFNSYFASDLFKYMKNNPLLNGEKYMDMVLFNFYNLYGPYWQKKASGYGIQAKAKVLRKLMTDSGIQVVPLFVTETGERSTGDWVGLDGQARCLNRTMVRGAAAKLTGIIWWTFRDSIDNPDWKYGIVNQNLQPKPSYTALQTVVAELNGLEYSKTKSNKTGFKGVESYYFVGGGMKKYVVWAFSKSNPPAPWVKPECDWPRNTAKATFNATKLRVVNYLGVVKTIKDNSKKDQDPAVGSIAIKVSGDPQIVQINPQ